MAAQVTERFHVLAQLEHLQSKYTGTGHADSNRWDWITNQHRDTHASNMSQFEKKSIGHPGMLSFIAVVENESRARTRFNLMNRMIQPCGPPLEKTLLDD